MGVMGGGWRWMEVVVVAMMGVMEVGVGVNLGGAGLDSSRAFTPR
jgi:hypothetical protein